MGIINVFNNEIAVKDYYCAFDNNPPTKIQQPYINIYVTLTNKCNADCQFCCNKQNCNSSIQFDEDKFLLGIKKIRESIEIRKLSFTGGEPTLEFAALAKYLKYVKDLDENIFTVINTNGTNLSEMKHLHQYLNSIALSRHHYDDTINQQIFGISTVASSNEIFAFPHKEILHLSCNLMRDYIRNQDEVVKYLEYVDSLGCDDVGFVTLMKVNNYCEQQFVDFNSLNFNNTNNVFVSQDWNYYGHCRCRNYLYIANTANVIRVYARYVCNRKISEGTLVFDGMNFRQGFGGTIIL